MLHISHALFVWGSFLTTIANCEISSIDAYVWSECEVLTEPNSLSHNYSGMHSTHKQVKECAHFG